MNAILEYILANYTWILFVLIIILLAIIGWYADKTNFGQGKKNNDESEDLTKKTLNEAMAEMKDKRLMDGVNELKDDTLVLESNDSVNNEINNPEENVQPSVDQNNQPTVVINNAIVQPIQSLDQFQTVQPLDINNNLQSAQIEHPVNDNTQGAIQMNFDPITGEPIHHNQKNVVDTFNNIDVATSGSQIVDQENNNLTNEANEQPIEKVTENITNVEEEKQPEIVFDENFEKKFNEIIPEKEIIDEGLLEDIENLTLDKTQKIDLSEIPDLDDVDLPRIKQMKTNDEGVWKF